MLSWVTIGTGISELKVGAVEVCFNSWGLTVYTSVGLEQERERESTSSQPTLIYLEENVKFNQKSGKTEQLNFKDGEPCEPVALKVWENNGPGSVLRSSRTSVYLVQKWHLVSKLWSDSFHIEILEHSIGQWRRIVMFRLLEWRAANSCCTQGKNTNHFTSEIPAKYLWSSNRWAQTQNNQLVIVKKISYPN